MILKPGVYQGTSVMTPAQDIVDRGIFPSIHVRTPWIDEFGCDCGVGKAAPVLHASWCELRLDWSWGDD